MSACQVLSTCSCSSMHPSFCCLPSRLRSLLRSSLFSFCICAVLAGSEYPHAFLLPVIMLWLVTAAAWLPRVDVVLALLGHIPKRSIPRMPVVSCVIGYVYAVESSAISPGQATRVASVSPLHAEPLSHIPYSSMFVSHPWLMCMCITHASSYRLPAADRLIIAWPMNGTGSMQCCAHTCVYNAQHSCTQ
jgi:hypothetical protein